MRTLSLSLLSQTVVDRRKALKLTQAQLPAATGINRAMVSNLENGWEPVIALLEEGIAKGVFRPVNPTILQVTFSAALESFLGGEELKTEGIGYADALEQLMDILMEGISY